ncbi:hypothetical protein B0H10DRAFT_1979433 [Mycena sp. CBHHK59/15]|nr:hypothetical protein B0H10DRAFT_1979433 [Mycena sp. CBHHK59/15]
MLQCAVVSDSNFCPVVLQPMNSGAPPAQGKDAGNGRTSTGLSKQNKADEKARRQATKDLTQSWMDRLQLISVITTFFASVEAGMLQVTTPGGGSPSTAPASQVANAGFLAALVLHIWAAIISFLAAFFLVRYNLKEAKEEEMEVALAPGSKTPPPQPSQLNRPETTQSIGSVFNKLQPVWTTNPHLEQVGPFQRKPPTHLLSRCHNLCILLTFIGFVLALLGIVAFAWNQQTIAVAVVTFASTGICCAGAAWVFM